MSRISLLMGINYYWVLYLSHASAVAMKKILSTIHVHPWLQCKQLIAALIQTIE
jgi:hypothetical protein